MYQKYPTTEGLQNAQVDVLAVFTASLIFSEGENFKKVVSQRRLLPPFEESSKCETIYDIRVDPESVDDW